MPERRRTVTESPRRVRAARADGASKPASPGAPTERWLLGQAQGLARGVAAGDPRASEHLARLLVEDSRGALQPFARTLAECLCDHVWRWAERGVTDPQITIGSDLQQRLREAAARILASPRQDRRRDDG